ncbi:MAG: ABC transporter substrate-binding protein [Streptosporangiales bacterium]|nr:ABC transporter substrate-binding protein [Streptosporangiales bacterium]
MISPQSVTRLLAAGTAFAALLAAAACGGGSGKEVTAIRVTVTNATEPYVIPWLAAQEQGFFEAKGVEVEDIIAGKGGSTTLRNLVGGKLAIGEVALPAVIEGKLAGAKVTAVAGATQGVAGLDWYASKTGPVKQVKDAKKWAFSNPGSVTESLAALLPEEAGLPKGSVTPVGAGGIGEGIAMLESGAVDLATVSPSVLARDASKFRRVLTTSTVFPKFQQTVLTVRDQYLKERPDVVKAVIAGYQQGVTWVKEHPAEAAELYAGHIGVEPEAARRIVDEAIAGDHWSAGLSGEALDTAVRAMKATGFTGKVPCGLFELSRVPPGLPRELPGSCPGGGK